MSRTLAAALLLLAPLGPIACAEYDMAAVNEDASGGLEGDWDTGTDAVQEAMLRLDVYPAEAAVPLTEQSRELMGWGSQGRIDLDASITIRGTVLGFSAAPAVDPVIPGEADVPVQAVVRAEVPGQITGAATTTDAEGRFSLTLPDAEGYLFSVVPTDENLPIYVATDLSFEDGEVVDIDLEYGEPLYGLVRQSDGSTVGVDATVRLLDPDTGVAGPRIEVGDDGHYMLRASPGSWLVELEGAEGEWLPRQLQAVTVEDGVGARLDLDVGILDEQAVFGEVVGPSGNPVDDAIVRLTALELTEADGRLVFEKETSSDGEWAQRLLPGLWLAEFIPPFDAEGVLSPMSMEFTVDGATEVETVALPRRVSVDIDVVDPANTPLPFVIVTATELGFDGYRYTGTTDESGTLSMELPPVPLDIRLTPPTAEWAITHYQLDDPAALAGSRVELQLSQGQLVEGILEAGGEPVPFAYVEIADAYDDVYGAALTDENGSFSVRIDPGELER